MGGVGKGGNGWTGGIGLGIACIGLGIACIGL